MNDPTDDEANLVIAELSKISDFLAFARKYGFAVTATPKGRKLLEKSRDPRAAFIRNNVCPVENDPWSKAHERKIG